MGIVYAQEDNIGIFKQNECIRLPQTCADCTYNNITTIISSNSTVLLSGQIPMTKSGTEYNHTFCNTTQSGKYTVNGIGDIGGTKTIWAYDFSVNPTGIEPSDQRTNALTRGIYFFFVLGIVCFILAVVLAIPLPYRLSIFTVGAMLVLICVNIIFVSLKNEVVDPKLANLFSFITVISFYIFWFLLALLLIIWIITFFITFLDKKKLKREQSFEGIIDG